MDEGARSSMPKNRRTKKNRARREKGFFTSHFACRRRQKTVQKRRVCEEEITNKKKERETQKQKGRQIQHQEYTHMDFIQWHIMEGVKKNVCTRIGKQRSSLCPTRSTNCKHFHLPLHLKRGGWEKKKRKTSLLLKAAKTLSDCLSDLVSASQPSSSPPSLGNRLFIEREKACLPVVSIVKRR